MLSLYNATNQCDIPIKVIKFPAGEMHVICDFESKFMARNRMVVTMNFEGSDDIMALCLLMDILRGKDVSLIMPYAPAARQDRRVNKDEAHGALVYSKIINSLGFKSIHISDPHSDVIEALYPDARIEDQCACFMNVMATNAINPNYIIAPDLGARKKAEKIAKAIGAEIIQCHKKRDLKTGEVIGFEIIEVPKSLDYNSEKNHMIVVDDCIDGGRTFVEVCNAIKCIECIFGTLDLYITHGIFSKGIDPVRMYDNIYCYNVMNASLKDKFTNFKLSKEI